jgi:polyhydroxyalkanoate synthase subunit PhaC
LAFSSNVIENWMEYSKNNMYLFSDYGLSYINTILNSLNLRYANDDNNINKDKINNNTNNNSSISSFIIDSLSKYDNLLYTSNYEFNKILRSKDSLQHFKDHIDSIVNLEKSIRQDSSYLLPFFSFLDSIIDNHLIFLNTLISINETPYKIIKQEDATCLLHYYPDTQNSTLSLPTSSASASASASASEQVYTSSSAKSLSPPLLMIYAPINRYHILDLSSERSIVKKFISAGFDVFLLDWGEKQSENKPTIKDYINYIDQSIEQIRKITKQEKINLYGYSWGGTLSIIYSSIYNSKIKNLILQSANFDFDKDNTVIAEWMRNFPVEKFVKEFKEMFGHFIDLAFLMRNPVAHSFDNLKFALEMNENEPAKFIQNLVKIRTWINNTPDIPGPLFKQFVVDLYQKNLLIKNQLILDGEEKEDEKNENTTTMKKRAIDLKNISMPILNIIGNKDDLVSSKSSIPITEEIGNGLISSKEKRLLEFPSGHVELCISYDAHENLWPQVIQWLKERS